MANGGPNAIAVIPARGGSKRIPGKNIRPFCGRPMIEYAIETALGTGLFGSVVVSTDSDDIAAIAEACGAIAPFRRPAHLADDFTPTADVIAHALREVDPTGSNGLACCIYPATPFLRTGDLEAGRVAIGRPDTDCTFAVCAYDAPIERAFAVRKDGGVGLRWPEFKTTRTNDLPEHVHDAGQFYWVWTRPFLDAVDFFSLRCAGIRLPRWRVHDIDTPEDWDRAELVYQALLARKDLD